MSQFFRDFFTDKDTFMRVMAIPYAVSVVALVLLLEVEILTWLTYGHLH